MIKDLLEELESPQDSDKKQNIKGTMGIRIYLNTMKQAFDAIIGTGIEAKYNEVDKGDYMEVVVIAVFNQKGGVGKTTTNVNLTASLGAMGKKILVLDLDPQGNTTSGYGIDKQSVDGTIYDVIIDGVDINETILNTEFENIDIVASDTDLAGCEIELTSRESREYILKNSIDKVREL